MYLATGDDGTIVWSDLEEKIELYGYKVAMMNIPFINRFTGERDGIRGVERGDRPPVFITISVIGQIFPRLAQAVQLCHSVGAQVSSDISLLIGAMEIDIAQLYQDFKIDYFLVCGFAFSTSFSTTAIVHRRHGHHGWNSMMYENSNFEEQQNHQQHHELLVDEEQVKHVVGALAMKQAISTFISLNIRIIQTHLEHLTLYAQSKLESIPGLKFLGPSSKKDSSIVHSHLSTSAYRCFSFYLSHSSSYIDPPLSTIFSQNSIHVKVIHQGIERRFTGQELKREGLSTSSHVPPPSPFHQVFAVVFSLHNTFLEVDRLHYILNWSVAGDTSLISRSRSDSQETIVTRGRERGRVVVVVGGDDDDGHATAGAGCIISRSSSGSSSGYSETQSWKTGDDCTRYSTTPFNKPLPQLPNSTNLSGNSPSLSHNSSPPRPIPSNSALSSKRLSNLNEGLPSVSLTIYDEDGQVYDNNEELSLPCSAPSSSSQTYQGQHALDLLKLHQSQRQMNNGNNFNNSVDDDDNEDNYNNNHSSILKSSDIGGLAKIGNPSSNSTNDGSFRLLRVKYASTDLKDGKLVPNIQTVPKDLFLPFPGDQGNNIYTSNHIIHRLGANVSEGLRRFKSRLQ